MDLLTALLLALLLALVLVLAHLLSDGGDIGGGKRCRVSARL